MNLSDALSCWFLLSLWGYFKNIFPVDPRWKFTEVEDLFFSKNLFIFPFQLLRFHLNIHKHREQHRISCFYFFLISSFFFLFSRLEDDTNFSPLNEKHQKHKKNNTEFSLDNFFFLTLIISFFSFYSHNDFSQIINLEGIRRFFSAELEL